MAYFSSATRPLTENWTENWGIWWYKRQKSKKKKRITQSGTITCSKWTLSKSTITRKKKKIFLTRIGKNSSFRNVPNVIIKQKAETLMSFWMLANETFTILYYKNYSRYYTDLETISTFYLLNHPSVSNKGIYFHNPHQMGITLKCQDMLGGQLSSCAQQKLGKADSET